MTKSRIFTETFPIIPIENKLEDNNEKKGNTKKNRRKFTAPVAGKSIHLGLHHPHFLIIPV